MEFYFQFLHYWTSTVFRSQNYRGMAEVESKTDVHILYAKHDDVPKLTGDWTTHVCSSVNKTLKNNHAVAAQKIWNIWIIGVRNEQSRSALLMIGHIDFGNGVQVKVYPHNPMEGDGQGRMERVVVRDLPLWEPNSLIQTFIKNNKQIHSNGTIHMSKARKNNVMDLNTFQNGDRYFWAQPNINPGIPKTVQIGPYRCRISYANQGKLCRRCGHTDHNTDQTVACKAYIASQPDVLGFTNGIFSNFDRCDVIHDGQTFRSSEHCYQWLAAKEALNDDVAEAIYKAEHPAHAKRLAARIKNDIPNWGELRDTIMEDVLRAKLRSSDAFREALIASGQRVLVEAQLDDYWGSGLVSSLTATTKREFWPGKNMLGKILMNIRNEVCVNTRDDQKSHSVTHDEKLSLTTSASGHSEQSSTSGDIRNESTSARNSEQPSISITRDESTSALDPSEQPSTSGVTVTRGESTSTRDSSEQPNISADPSARDQSEQTPEVSNTQLSNTVGEQLSQARGEQLVCSGGVSDSAVLELKTLVSKSNYKARVSKNANKVSKSKQRSFSPYNKSDSPSMLRGVQLKMKPIPLFFKSGDASMDVSHVTQNDDCDSVCSFGSFAEARALRMGDFEDTEATK